MHKIIYETCDALWDCLYNDFVKFPSTDAEWKSIANEFEQFWNYPHCVGAIDGKHIAIKAPKNAGSDYFNYKGFHSLVLLAVIDARYKFVMTDIGAYGRESDGGVLAKSEFGIKLNEGRLGLPKPEPIAGIRDPMPYVFVADAAFPLKENMMRPYPGSYLEDAKLTYNYRHSRARRISENGFGILSSRWRIFRGPIDASPNNVAKITKACIALHNYLASTDFKNTPQTRYIPPNAVDRENSSGVVSSGDWRGESSNMRTINRVSSNMASRQAVEIRDNFNEYFLSDQGKVPWQENVIRRGRKD